MRVKVFATALLCSAAAFAPASLQAADSFTSELLVRGSLGAQPLGEGQILSADSALRLSVTASADTILSVVWHQAGAPAQVIASAVALKAGETLALPGAEGWLAGDAGQGRAFFEITAKDGQGVAEQEQLVYLVSDAGASSFDQTAFSGFTQVRPGASVTPLAGFASPLHGFSALDLGGGEADEGFIGGQKARLAAQLAKVPMEAPLYNSPGAQLFKKVANGVVLVLTEDGIGSGSLITQDGYIVTNWHVVGDYKVVGVVFRPPQGTPLSADMILPATVERVSKTQDLALLKLQKTPANPTLITIGSLSEVDIGDDVHAVGHPHGESWTYTRGYISQIRQDYIWESDPGVQKKAEVIQTQTPINPGNSGGPLMDNEGRMIGVNTFTDAAGQGLNYAVSINEVTDFLATPVASNGNKSQPPSIPQTGGQKQSQPPAPQTPAPQPQPPQQQAQDPAQQGLQPIDTNGDGKPDAWGADRNGDGYYDAFLIDEDGDGQADYALYDENYNGVIDTRQIPMEDEQGPYDVWAYDKDEDGKAELLGFDWDRDGVIDEWRQV